MKKIFCFIILAISILTANSFAQTTERHHRWHDANEQHDRRYRSPYLVSNNKVFFDGKRIEGAYASSFEILKDGYAKDKWNVYYDGKKVSGASPKNFEVLKYGYAKDKWNVYFDGEKVKGATPNSFTVLQDGYAEDRWNTYYWGKKIK